MANNGEIVIRIVGEGEGTNEVQPQPSQPKKKDKNNDLLGTAVMLSVVKRAGEELKQIAISEATYEIGKYMRLTDNYFGQQNLNIAKNIVNRASNIGMSIAGGFVVGGPFGAIAAAAVSAVNLGVDIYQNYDQQNIRLRQMDTNLSFNRQRAGYSLTAGSVGENR